MLIGKHRFDRKDHTYVCGILNVTPDSFSDGGTHTTVDEALYHAETMIRDGAELLDIGGESTRPGYTRISDEEEMERILPVIERLHREVDVPLSVDTYKSRVAKAAIEAGADLINDIWGCKADPEMAKVIAEGNAACCLMHNRKEAVYRDFYKEVMADLEECAKLALKAGVPAEKIMLDPGIGFAKDQFQNREMMRRLPDMIKECGYPVLLGTSRKSMIGTILNVPASERTAGTLATTIMGCEAGCRFVRVHDVLENVQAIKVYEAIRNERERV